MALKGPPHCHECQRRVRRWQKYGGWGPIGFSPKKADVVWHTKCLRRRGHEWVLGER